jgi:methylase of polypeptide subunit release factors
MKADQRAAIGRRASSPMTRRPVHGQDGKLGKNESPRIVLRIAESDHADGRVDAKQWAGSAWQTESTLHQLAPYIGKTKSTMAACLVERFTTPDQLLYDPFSGSGTIALEAWLAGRRVIANDRSPYAALLTRAKLHPYSSLDEALEEVARTATQVAALRKTPDLRSVPAWVREFFHPETLREIIAWTRVLKRERRHFLLACLLGILHHQRPGFLSFPSSHTVPYLRTNIFPRRTYPNLYKYRSLTDRLEAKVKRAFRRVPEADHSLRRECHSRDAARFSPSQSVDVIITSPPYMRQLDYGRDNRLRLWFLGCDDWKELDQSISPREAGFLALMRRCFKCWRPILRPRGHCILIVGNECSRVPHEDLPGAVIRLATTDNDFELISEQRDRIPNERRVRRGITGSVSETIIVLRSTRKLTDSPCASPFGRGSDATSV